MLSQGALEQNSFASGYSRTSITNQGRTLETNTENLLRMVVHLAIQLIRSYGDGKLMYFFL